MRRLLNCKVIDQLHNLVDKITVRVVLPERTANADPVENSMIAKSDRKKDLENNFIVKFNF